MTLCSETNSSTWASVSVAFLSASSDQACRSVSRGLRILRMVFRNHLMLPWLHAELPFSRDGADVWRTKRSSLLLCVFTFSNKKEAF